MNNIETFFSKYTRNFFYKNDTRINRKQFFIRIIILFIPITALWIFLSIVAPQMSQQDLDNFRLGIPVTSPSVILMMNISWIIIYGFFYWVILSLCLKRYADFNNNGKTAKVLIPLFFILNVYSFLMGIYSAYFGNPIIKYTSANEGFFYYFFSVIGSFAMASFLCMILMALFLFFKKGDTSENTYGTPPIGNS